MCLLNHLHVRGIPPDLQQLCKIVIIKEALHCLHQATLLKVPTAKQCILLRHRALPMLLKTSHQTTMWYPKTTHQIITHWISPLSFSFTDTDNIYFSLCISYIYPQDWPVLTCHAWSHHYIYNYTNIYLYIIYLYIGVYSLQSHVKLCTQKCILYFVLYMFISLDVTVDCIAPDIIFFWIACIRS